jgi:hypothetical protein
MNIAAEDDFRDMGKWDLVDSIENHRIYNLAVRNGRSPHHHGAGYLIHPVLSEVVAGWL